MKRRFALALLAVMNTGATHAQPADTVWPAVTRTARPWTRWWWPGNAVDPAQLTAQLEAFATAGIGGVEITPIYGAQGAEEHEIPFLSPRWVKMLEHTAAEARRLGLGVDMATGTGWPFGGPGVPPEDGSSSITLVDGKLSGKPTGMKVKRAAPGGEGLVLDPYSTVALERYLERFTRSLQGLARGRVRSQFHDSFEYYEASWSPDLVRKFRAMHGYDIQDHAAGFAGAEPMNADTLGRIKGDYRRTLSAMHLEYVQSWVQWSHSQGFKARNQAHGSPGRLLDLYSAADIPETESFGASRLPIRGLRLAPEDIREDPDPPIGLIGRFASSAAHFNGRNLVSSEVLTWLRENFRESPQAAKPQLDRQFIAGINHVFYHGATYSPPDAGWPGWYFYAATQLNPSNPLWRDFAAMHAYVARIQSILQAGQADNDLLLYWPEADEQDDPDGFMRHHNVHENAWLVGSPAGRRALQLIESGYSPDFVSDAQIHALKVENGMLVAPGGRYRGLIVPATQRMDVGTLRALARLREAGAALHIDALPTDVPGFGHLEERRAELRRIVASGALRPANPAGPDSLTIPGAIREPVAKFGLWFTRRARPDGHDYFVVNATAFPFDGWVPLGTRAHSAILLDPLSGAAGSAAVHRRASGPPSVYLQLGSGESVILRTSRATQRRGLATWPYHVAGHSAEELTGDWRVDFVSGGETLPNGFTTRELGSWTELARPTGQSFSGTAHYQLQFDAPAAPADDWLLDLGEVRETARVTLNGRLLATLWSLPMKVRAAGALKSRGNVLEIEVTNLPANRVRDLDGRKVPWKIMKDINLPNLRYQPLDASLWDPLPSGLIGPVRLVPLRRLSPEPPN